MWNQTLQVISPQKHFENAHPDHIMTVYTLVINSILLRGVVLIQSSYFPYNLYSITSFTFSLRLNIIIRVIWKYAKSIFLDI